MIYIYPTKQSTSFYLEPSYVIEIDGSVEKIKFENKVYIYYGLAFNEKGKVTLTELIKKDPALLLNDCGGAYVLIVIDCSIITIYKSIYRGIDLFYRNGEDGFYLSDEIDNLMVSNDKNISALFCECFLKGEVNSYNLTPFEGVLRITGGTQTTLKNNHVSQAAMITKVNSHSTVLEQLNVTLNHFTNQKQVGLYLSGGFDSKVIFHSLLKNKIDFEVFHFLPYDFEPDNEVKTVENLCFSHKIRLNLLKRKLHENDFGRAQDKISTPYDLSFVKESMNGNTLYESCLDSNDYVFLNGHGGDSVFVQNPSRNVGVDYMLQGAPWGAMKKMIQLSTLKSCSLSGILKDNVRSYFKTNQKNRDNFEHPWLEEFRPGSARYEHLSHILYMTETTPILESNKSQMFSPILSPNFFMKFVVEDYGRNFNNIHDRVYMRDMAYQAFNDHSLYDITKRSSSVFVFHAFRANKDCILRTINEGSVANLLSLDKRNLTKSLNYNIDVGFDENTDLIINLHRIQSFYDLLIDGEANA